MKDIMEMKSIIMLTMLLISHARAESYIITNGFAKMETFDSYTCKSGDYVVSQDDVRTVLTCLSLCASHEECKAAFYEKVHFMCHGCGSTYAAEGVALLPPLAGSVYYRKDARATSWLIFGQSSYSGDFSNAVHYTDAQHFCEDFGAHLVVIDTQEEQDFVKQLASQSIDPYDNIVLTGIWIGMQKDLTTTTWRVTHTQLPASYINWGDNEPNDIGGEEGCAASVYAFDWKWADVPCTEKIPFYTLCEREN